MKKVRKIIIITLLVLLSIIAIALAGGTIYYNLVLKEQVSEIVTTFDDLIKSGELYEQLKPYLEEQAKKDSTAVNSENVVPTASPDIVSTPTPKTTEKPNKTPVPNETTQQPIQTPEPLIPQFSSHNTAEAVTNEIKVQFENTVTPGEAVTPPTVENTDIPAEEPVAEEEEKKTIDDYSSPYDYIKDNTSASDFARGISLASRIDIGYVVGLLKGGLTLPEKKELYRYLKSRFTEKEMYEGVAIFNKYSHLFE